MNADSYGKSLTRRWTEAELTAIRAKALLLGHQMIRLSTTSDALPQPVIPARDFQWDLKRNTMIDHGYIIQGLTKFRWTGCHSIALALEHCEIPLYVCKHLWSIPPRARDELEALLQ